MDASNAITLLEMMRRKKRQALEALEAIDVERFYGLASGVAIDDAALAFALDTIRSKDQRADRILDVLDGIIKRIHQAHHTGAFGDCPQAVCSEAMEAGVRP